MRLFTTILFSLFSFGLFSQEITFDYTVYLKNGTVFDANFHSYVNGFIFEYGKDKQIFVRSGRIKSIIPKAGNQKSSLDLDSELIVCKLKKDYQTRGLYYSTLGKIGGSLVSDYGFYLADIGLQQVVGYQYSQHVGVGLGLGVISLNASSGENLIPLTFEFRGYLREGKVSPFYNLSAGYAFAPNFLSNRILDASGGFYSHQSLGLKIGSNKISFLFDVGVQLARADFIKTSFSGPDRAVSRDYSRLIFRVGFMF